MSLTRFDPDRVCPKCGHDDVGTLYLTSTAAFACRALRHQHLDREHLHRTCQRCRYEWVERPLTDDEAQAAQAEVDARREADRAALAALDAEDEDEDEEDVPWE